MKRPWTFKEGIEIGCGLLAVACLLQLCIGQINWTLTAWPINALILAFLLVSLVVMNALRNRVYLFAWLSSSGCAISAMAFAVAVTILLGLITQKPSSCLSGSWIHHLLSSWPFVVVYVWLTVSLGMTILRVGSTGCWTWRTVAFMLNHLGLFIVLVAATLGNADMQRLSMLVGKESMGYGPQAIAYNDISPMHEPVKLDFSLVLRDFEIEYYAPDSMKYDEDVPHPRNFTSHVSIYANDKDNSPLLTDTVIKVNKPLSINGWKIYQYRYDNAPGMGIRYSEFQLVRDPWLLWVYIGIYMMLAGALALIMQSAILYGKRGKASWLTVCALLLCIMLMAYVFVPIISKKQLMPALQSAWFAPHVLVYMIAYALMGAAALLAFIGLLRRRSVGELSVLDNIVYVGLALLTFGMLFGALWAKEAWGHYWSWDPKETWAATTWLCYLIYIHFRLSRPQREPTALWILIAAFVLLQMCWWGINYLQSAQATSLHTYN